MNSVIRPARFEKSDLEMPKPTWLAVDVTLQDFAIVSYAVEPNILSRQLPSDFEPEIFNMTDGSEKSLISAVTFFDTDFRLRSCPWPRFSFGQTNYRAYVIHRGKRAAWFFGTSLATPFVAVPRHLWHLPWHHAHMQFNTKWDQGMCQRYDLITKAAWGSVDLSLEGSGEQLDCLDGFIDCEDVSVILTHPLIGYYKQRDGRIGTYSIWHKRLDLQKASVQRAHFDVFRSLNLIDAETDPHSALIQRTTDFTIMLPPRLHLTEASARQFD